MSEEVTQDSRERVADLMCDAGGELAHGREAIGGEQTRLSLHELLVGLSQLIEALGRERPLGLQSIGHSNERAM